MKLPAIGFQPRPRSSATTLGRVLWLLACVALGTAVGVLCRALTGSDFGYLAIPGAVALGWLFVANPAECRPGGDRPEAPP